MKKQEQNEQDIVGLMIKIQGQLAALDRKMDVLLGRSSGRQGEVKPVLKAPSHELVHAHDPVPGILRPPEQRRERQMYAATCADCKKECEIPFKPTGDRPVYCKDCFVQRKAAKTPKNSVEMSSQEIPAVPAAMPVAASASESEPAVVVKDKKKPAAAKKSVAKKKPAAAKKKK